MNIRRRLCLSLPSAIALSIVLAGQAVAATWNPPITLATEPLTAAGGLLVARGLATVDPSTAIVVFRDHDAVFVRRSTDSGATWASPVRLSRVKPGWTAGEPAIAAFGDSVDVVWNEGESSWTDESPPHRQIRYSRSSDGGATFSHSVALAATTPAGAVRAFHTPVVAHGPNGVVAVGWVSSPNEQEPMQMAVRVSTDDGATFGAAQRLSGSAEVFGPAVAVGDGVIYAAYAGRHPLHGLRGIHLWRSLDAGTSWGDSVLLGGLRSRWWGVRLTAQGSEAYAAFDRKIAHAGYAPSYRHTPDKGMTWSPRALLARPVCELPTLPVISLESGVVRAAFSLCGPAVVADADVYYRESFDGVTWTRRERVSPDGEAYAAGVGFADNIVVVYNHSTTTHGERTDTIQVRTATP